MNPKNIFFAIFLLLVTLLSANAAQLFESLSGLISEDRVETTFFVYLKSPRRLSFVISDPQGKPLPDISVVEAVLSSDPKIGVKNPDGIGIAELPEAGIYEIKVRTKRSGVAQGFNLKIMDEGEYIGKVEQTDLSAKSEPISSIDFSTGSIELVPLVASPPILQIASSTLIGVSTSVQISSAAVSQVDDFAPSATFTEAMKKIASVSATLEKLASHPSSSLLTSFAVKEKYPHGEGYLDPYQPISIVFNQNLPENLPVSDLLKVYVLDLSGQLQMVEGQWFVRGKNTVQFIAKKYIPGTVYIARVFNPVTFSIMDEFTFRTVPEILPLIEKLGNEISVTLKWNSNPNLFQSDIAQVLRLDDSEIKIYGLKTGEWTLGLNSKTAPTGNFEGVAFYGKPFEFSLKIPQELVASHEIKLSLFLKLANRQNFVEVARVSAKIDSSGILSEQPASMPIPLHTSHTSSSLQQPTASSTNELSDEDSEESSEIANMPAVDDEVQVSPMGISSTLVYASSSIELPSVEALPDPGQSATAHWVRTLFASEWGGVVESSWPKGITWDSDGALWIVDSQQRRIIRVTENGKVILAFGRKGKDAGALGLPIDIAVASDRVFISDTSFHCVHIFDRTGNFVKRIGTWGVAIGQLDLPYGIAFGLDHLWVADRGNSRINKFSSDGIFKGAFGKKGELKGYLINPIGVKVDATGIWVLEENRGRIQFFSHEGKYIRDFSVSDVKETAYLELDMWGYLWIVDSEGKKVIRVDKTGKILTIITGSNSIVNWTPTAVAVRKDGTIAIADGANRAIHIFKLK